MGFAFRVPWERGNLMAVASPGPWLLHGAAPGLGARAPPALGNWRLDPFQRVSVAIPDPAVPWLCQLRKCPVPLMPVPHWGCLQGWEPALGIPGKGNMGIASPCWIVRNQNLTHLFAHPCVNCSDCAALGFLPAAQPGE